MTDFTFKKPCSWIPEVPGVVVYVVVYGDGDQYCGYTEQFANRMREIFNGLGDPQFEPVKTAQYILHYQRQPSIERAQQYTTYLKTTEGMLFLRSSMELNTVFPI